MQLQHAVRQQDSWHGTVASVCASEHIERSQWQELLADCMECCYYYCCCGSGFGFGCCSLKRRWAWRNLMRPSLRSRTSCLGWVRRRNEQGTCVFDSPWRGRADGSIQSDWCETPRKSFRSNNWTVLLSTGGALTCTILLSDNGLDDETPESEAQDLTDAERTIFGTVSSGDGEVDECTRCAVIKEGHDEAVASK